MSYTQAQLNAMTDQQLIAAGMPVAIDAPYSATYDPLMQDPAYNPSAVTSGTLAAQQSSQNTAPASPGFFSGLSGISGLPSLQDALSNSPFASLTGGATPAAAGNSGSGWSGFWSFVGNPIRIGTTVVGGIMIAAGIFALSRGSGVTVNIPMPAGGTGSTERGETGRAHDRTETHHVKF